MFLRLSVVAPLTGVTPVEKSVASPLVGLATLIVVGSQPAGAGSAETPETFGQLRLVKKRLWKSGVLKNAVVDDPRGVYVAGYETVI